MEMCFVCSNSVLGLFSQDTICHKYDMQQQPEDQEMLREEAYGDCHLVCLIGSKWGHYWAERTRYSMVHTRRGEVIYDADGWLLIRNKHSKSTYLLREGGWQCSVSDQGLRDFKSIKNGILVPIHYPYHIDISNYPALTAQARHYFKQGQDIPLLELVDAHKVRRYLFSEEALHDAVLSPLPEAPEKISRQPTWIAAEVHYQQFLPEDGAKPLLAALASVLPLTPTQHLLQAVQQGNLSKLQELLDQNVSVNAKDEQGITPLMQAARYSQLDVAVKLLDRGAEIDALDKYDRSALFHAVSAADTNMMYLLLHRGASPTNSEGENVIAFAEESGLHHIALELRHYINTE